MSVLPAAKIIDQPRALEELSERQGEVLAAVLDLMVEEGDAFSMASVARRANCSKETLYKWFGDRNGLLTATVRWQAAKVAMPNLPGGRLTRTALAENLRAFAVNWLKVLTGDVSVALNRLAIAHAGSAKSALGRIVRQNGPYAMAERLEPVFLAGREAGIITFGVSQLYITLGDPQASGGFAVTVYHKPLVTLIWLGAVVMFAGAVTSLSDRRLRVGAPQRARVQSVPAE